MSEVTVPKNNQSALILDGIAGEFEERTSKAGKNYFSGGIFHTPERATEPVFLRCFASSWAFRDGAPAEGDYVIVNANLSAERDGGVGLSISNLRVLGQGEVFGDDEDDTEDDNLPF